MIYIRFIADSGFISRSIGLRTEGRPSHVEYIITDNAGYAVNTFGARFKGGITHRAYDYCKPVFEEWYSFPGIEASYKHALLLKGRKYDWGDIVALLVGWHPDYYDPQRGICSGLVGYSNRMAWAAGEAPAFINPNVPTWELTPQLLYGACGSWTQMVKKVL